jgi:hypothetical protein
MFLRVARPVDAIAVARVHVRSWQAAYRGLLFDEYLDALQPEEWALRYSFTDPQGTEPVTVLAVEGSEICGLATIGPAGADERQTVGELLALYVDPDRFAEACLWVLAGNEWAERFYRLDGWLPDGSRRPAKVAGYSVEDVRYRRSLP